MMQTQAAIAATPGGLAEVGIIELVPGRLYLLGGSIALDGRISWVPAEERGWQPINAYVLREGNDALIVDPGIFAHRDIIRRQLDALVLPGADLSIFLTRAEPDSAGNIGEVGRRYLVRMLYAGGGPNPFDAFDSVEMLDPRSTGNRIQMERQPAGYQIPIGGARGLEILRPIVRLLATYWAYDRATRTLFTSDSFGHCLQQAPDGPRVTTASPSPWSGRGHVRAHMLAKFGWLLHARTQSVVNNLREMRGTRDIDRIAPGRGLVIEGHAAVNEHLDAFEAVLQELAG